MKLFATLVAEYLFALVACHHVTASSTLNEYITSRTALAVWGEVYSTLLGPIFKLLVTLSIGRAIYTLMPRCMTVKTPLEIAFCARHLQVILCGLSNVSNVSFSDETTVGAGFLGSIFFKVETKSFILVQKSSVTGDVFDYFLPREHLCAGPLARSRLAAEGHRTHPRFLILLP